jgi:hypothetical protein
MKTITLAAIACLAITVVSCKKDYVCQCTTVGSSYSGSSTSSYPGVIVTKRDIPKTSKKTAEAICGDYVQTTSSSYTSQGVTYTFSDIQTSTCSLK